MTTKAITVRALDDLAAEIRAQDVAARTAAGTALEHARRCGDLLIRAKGQLRHGGWRAWLAEHTSVSERTAQNYMRLAREWEALAAANPQRVSDFGVRKALHFVTQERRRAEITERCKGGVSLVDLSPSRPPRPPDPVLSPADAERLAALRAARSVAIAAVDREVQAIFDRGQMWAEAMADELWEAARPRLDALEAEIETLRRGSEREAAA